MGYQKNSTQKGSSIAYAGDPFVFKFCRSVLGLLINPLKVVREMNNYDLWKWAAGKRTEKDKNETYSAKNWWYVLLMLGVFVGIMLLYYLISVLWN